MEDIVKRLWIAVIALSCVILIGIVSYAASVKSSREKVRSIELKNKEIQYDLKIANESLVRIKKSIIESISDSEQFTKKVVKSTTERKLKLNENINEIRSVNHSTTAIIDSLDSTINKRYPFD